jgi:uncharacterized protein YkwD
MNWIDILLLIVIIIAIWNGWNKGFLLGSLALLGWLGSVYAGFAFYPYMEKFFERFVPSLGVWLTPLAFILTIILARLILSVIINEILRITPRQVHYSTLNHAAGMIPGFLNGLIYAIILSALLLAFPLSQRIADAAKESTMASNFALQVEWMSDKLSPVFDKAVDKGINKLTVEPKSNEIVELPFKTARFKERPDLEARMLQMVNNERRKVGLDTLRADTALQKVALAHSADMFKRGYFAHYTPEGKDPFDRMRDAHVRFFLAGENLALAQTLPIAHQGLMNSPGHRENILRPGFGRLGIGILDGGFYGLMISQEFRN